LESFGLDANVLGRIVRIRMKWPQLAPGVYYINERIGPHDVRYFLGIPKGYDRAKAWPLVIKLPTADAFLADPPPDPVQVTEIYSTWMSVELNQHPDAVLIMPLINLEELWGPSYIGMNNVIQPMLHAAGRVNIDPARVYLVGHANSGNATWNLGLHYTTYFAAFNVLAGGATQPWQMLRLPNLKNVLPVVWQDANDDVLPPAVARQIIGGLRTQKITVDYKETRNVGHTPTPEIAEERYQKMRARTRELYPKQISIQSSRPDTMFNRNDWAQIYQPLDTSEGNKVFFSYGKGYMVNLPVPYTLSATIEKNAITITTRNVATMRLYLNDQMIDFSRAVSVVQGRKAIYEAIVKPNIEEMLKDQLFLGRGWRYYTVIIDIDLAAGSDRQRGATSRPRSTSPDDAAP
jgi:hypothetical protein